jgi:hypothetical protein
VSPEMVEELRQILERKAGRPISTEYAEESARNLLAFGQFIRAAPATLSLRCAMASAMPRGRPPTAHLTGVQKSTGHAGGERRPGGVRKAGSERWPEAGGSAPFLR